jgi:hypothetical protein
VSIEGIVKDASHAQFRLDASPRTSLAQAEGSEPRYAQLAAVKTANVRTFDKDVNADGGNDCYEEGVLRPDLVLGDLIAIFHRTSIRTTSSRSTSGSRQMTVQDSAPPSDTGTLSPPPGPGLRRTGIGIRFAVLAVVLALVVAAGITVGPVTLPIGDILKALTGGHTPPGDWAIIYQVRLPRTITATACGAAAVLAAVLGLGRAARPSNTLLLLGVMLGYLAFAAVAVLLAGASPQRVQEYVEWGFGSFEGSPGRISRSWCPCSRRGCWRRSGSSR